MSQGVVAMVANSATKVTFGHANAEPDFLGWDVASMLKSMLATVGQEAAVKAQVVALVSAPGRDVTLAELNAWLATHPHPEITTVAQFNAKLRSLLGDIPGTLAFGAYEDYLTFNADPGFSQVDWGYLADFDTRVFEIYRGAQLAAPTRGRLVGVPLTTNPLYKQYYPLQMVGSFTFDQVNAATLPTRWWAS